MERSTVNEQFDLEVRGERATNYLRALLLVAFMLASIMALTSPTIRRLFEYFVIGIAFYGAATAASLYVTARARYRPWMKYLFMALELTGLVVVHLSFFTLDAFNWSQAVKNPARFAIYFLLIGASMLKFSPRFTAITSVACALAYLGLHLLLVTVKGLALSMGPRVHSDPSQLGVADLLVGTLFILAMGMTLAIGTKLARSMVKKTEESEELSRARLARLEELLGRNAAAARELEQAVKRITEISLANDDASRDQLASVEETTATIEQLSASIKSIAMQAERQDDLCDRNAASVKKLNEMSDNIEHLGRDSNNRGQTTLENAIEGERELTRVQEDIKRIEEGSQQVAEIVTVINDIADRTNLLALNAAIEAARAGQEGRGFSVVADEVGKLADMSSKNAREIERLIQATRKDTRTGVQSIEKTVTVLQGIIAGIKGMAGSTAEAYRYFQEQRAALAGVRADTETIQHMSREMRNATGEQLKGMDEMLRATDTINIRTENFVQTSESLRGAAEVLEQANRRLAERPEEEKANRRA